MKEITKINVSSWKEEYLRVLTSDSIEPKDYELASELLDYGYGKGFYKRSNLGDNKIAHLTWKNTTIEGRLFADELKSLIYKESLSYKIKVIMFTVGGWLGGLLSALIINKL